LVFLVQRHGARRNGGPPLRGFRIHTDAETFTLGGDRLGKILHHLMNSISR
jgi:hypothetical protein